MFRRPTTKRNNDILTSVLDNPINSVYSYFLGNDSLTLRVVEYLHLMPQLPIQAIKVIHQSDGWAIDITMNHPLTPQLDGDFRAFMNELGIACDRKHACPWYIYTTWKDGSPLSRLYTTTKVLYSSIAIWARAILKRSIN